MAIQLIILNNRIVTNYRFLLKFMRNYPVRFNSQENPTFSQASLTRI